MAKYIIIVLFVFNAAAGYTQTNLFSVLHFNDEREYKTKRPKKIIETDISYGSDKTTTSKSIKLFDNAGMLLSIERYDEDGTLKIRLKYVNDTIRRLLLTSTLEMWTNIKSLNSTTTTYYTYDPHNFLIRTEDKNNGITFSRTEITNNSQGNPVELTGFDKNGALYGTETAMYLYDKNRAIISVFNNKGRLVSTSRIKISFTAIDTAADCNEKYNDRGDLISYNNKEFTGTPTEREELYEYDEFGNCTSEKIYVVTTKINGKKRHTLERVYLKQYFY